MESFLNREAPQLGLTRANLRSSAYLQPVNGASMPAIHGDDLAAICRTVARMLPKGSVFTHVTAAQLRRWWLPEVDFPIIACSDSVATHQDRRGVYVRRCAIPPWHREQLDGVPIASPAWTIVELAEHLALVDLVVVLDCALHLNHTDRTSIEQALVPGRRGVRVLRRALTLCDGRSESAWETVLRLLHVLGGVEVEPQFAITNAVGGVVARADLRIRGTRRLPEYDGADHRDRDRHQRDLAREKQLARDGWERYGYVAREITRDAARILRDADEALGRPHDTRRVAWWMEHARQSSLYSEGREALRARLDRFVRTTSRRTARASSSGARQPRAV